jgi:MOB kinase activator 1
MLPSDKSRSFKPKKKIEKGQRGYGLRQIAKMTLGSGNLELAVELPQGEDLNEWLAVNTIEFYNEINLLYGTLTEFCTPESCPVMSAGPKYEYLWADGQNVKTPLKVSAAEYIDYLMTWVESQLNNDALFPTQSGVPFPRNFLNVVKVVFKRLFRVYAHIYHTHFQHIMSLGMEYHLNTCFKHFIFFIDRFRLVDAKELAPLAELIQQFKDRGREMLEREAIVR